MSRWCQVVKRWWMGLVENELCLNFLLLLGLYLRSISWRYNLKLHFYCFVYGNINLSKCFRGVWGSWRQNSVTFVNIAINCEAGRASFIWNFGKGFILNISRSKYLQLIVKTTLEYTKIPRNVTFIIGFLGIAI